MEVGKGSRHLIHVDTNLVLCNSLSSADQPLQSVKWTVFQYDVNILSIFKDIVETDDEFVVE